MTSRAGVSTKPTPPRDLVVAGVIIAAVLAILFSMAAVIIYTVGYASGTADAEKVRCETVAPKVVYRRGIDTLSPVELRRLASARERMEKVGP